MDVANLYHGLSRHVEMADPARARIARYGWGDDYHDVMGRRLGDLARWMRDAAGPGFDARWCVDDGPVQEKVYASRAGVGWVGKNTCVINTGIGSWILLGVLVSNAVLEPDNPAVDRCGTCRLCVDACPAGPVELTCSMRGAVSSLTIETGAACRPTRGPASAPTSSRDICQDVCPQRRGACRPDASLAAEGRSGKSAAR
jgi:epoxyqueuosine reductase